MQRSAAHTTLDEVKQTDMGGDSDRNGSCSLGCYDDGDERHRKAREVDADLMDALEELDNCWVPSGPQQTLMAGLCRELHLNRSEVTKGLDTAAAYSAKLTELQKQRQEQRQALGHQITAAQVNYMKILNVPSTEYAHLTKAEAADLISDKVAERQLAPPTGPQLKMLKDLKYRCTAPATKSKATEIISKIRKEKCVAYLREKARRKGTNPVLLQRLIDMVVKYDL